MSHNAVRRLELTITPADAGVRVELLLRRKFGLSGTVIRRIKWLEDGILLDGARVCRGWDKSCPSACLTRSGAAAWSPPRGNWISAMRTEISSC